MSREADRHLIFGLFALQNGLIDHDQLLAGFRAWTRDKARPIADHLAALGHIDARRTAAVEAMVALHIEDHGGDASKSLAALGAGPSTVERLAGISDTDLHDSLATVAPGLDVADRYPTVSRVIGDSTTHGRRFRFLRPHAHGGLGEVSVALDAELNREVALKEILARHADDPGSRSRFLLEAEITGGLEHPGIVPVYGLGTYADGRPYYAMRFIRGDTLKQGIASFHEDALLKSDPGQKSLALRRLLRRFTDVCNAVEYAHSRGVLHRDLKPANVVLGRHGETLVIDWGLAKATGHVDPRHDFPEPTLAPSSSGDSSTETLPGQAVGTPAYMSPEQAAGRIDLIGVRSDVYGLGATLYHLLTNQPPTAGKDMAAIFQAIERGQFPRPRELSSSIDPALEAIALRAMALDPSNRYSSARALADDLERWTADEPVLAWPEPFARRARRWMRRNRVLVTAASAALLVAAVGLAVVSAVQARANRALTDANKLKDQANIELKLANERAEARFDLARDAIKTYSTGVQEDELLKSANLKPLRDKLLRSAAGFYETLETLLQAQADEKSRDTLAAAYMDLGRLIEQIGIQPEALAAYRKALAIHRDLAAAPGSGDLSRSGMATCLIYAGRLDVAMGDAPGGIKQFIQARKILDLLTKANPSNIDYQADLANSHNDLGNVLSDTGDSARALLSHGEALKIRLRLAQANTSTNQNQSDLANSHNNIGFVLAAKGDAVGALRSYREALEIQSRLAKANPTVPEYQSELAISHSNIGNVLFEAGDAPGALVSFRQALEIQSRLALANPSVNRYQADMANSHNNIGFEMSSTGDHPGALRSLGEALEIQSRLAKANPAVSRYQADMATSHNDIGSILLKNGDATGALRSFREALEVQSRLAQANPAVTQYQADLAFSHGNIGVVLSKAGDAAGALQSYRDALEIQLRLAEANPEVTQFQSLLASSHNNMGFVLSSTGDAAGALRSYREALRVRSRLAQANPTVPEYQSELATIHNNIAVEMSKAGETAGAVRSFDDAIVIWEELAGKHPDVADYRRELSKSLFAIGSVQIRQLKPAQAIAALRRSASLLEGLPASQVNLIGATKVRSQLVKAGRMTGSGMSAEEVDREAEAAASSLGRAIAAGYRDLKTLGAIPDLAPIRDRPDVQVILMDLAFPSNPFADDH